MKRNHLPLKEFINQLKSTLKGKYNAAVWPIAGITLLYLALTALLALLFTRSAMMLGYATMLIMYGMISQVLLAVVEALGILILWFLVTFGMYFVNMSILYSYQDQIKNPNLKVSATTIWKHFKHLNKNQLLRLTLYSSLFIFLWTLPLDIVDRSADRQLLDYVLEDFGILAGTIAVPRPAASLFGTVNAPCFDG